MSDCSASAVWSGSRSWTEADEWEWSAVLNLTWLLLLSVIVLSEDNILPPSDETSIIISMIRCWFPRLDFTSALKHKLKAEIKDEEEDERSVTDGRGWRSLWCFVSHSGSAAVYTATRLFNVTLYSLYGESLQSQCENTSVSKNKHLNPDHNFNNKLRWRTGRPRTDLSKFWFDPEFIFFCLQHYVFLHFH